MGLEAIAYVSSAKQLLSEEDLEQLLLTARQRNAEQEVTGVLLYNRGTFFQYIEGPAEGLSIIFQKIQAASQHHGIITLMHEAVGDRAFPEWHMGFTEAVQSELLDIAQADWKQTLSAVEGASQHSAGMSLLINYWRSTRH